MENLILAKKIINARKHLGLSQEALAEKSNVSLSTIQRIEKGTVKPRAFTLKVLAEALQIELTELVCHDVEKKVSNETISALKKINLYTMFFVFFPFVNMIIPLLFWKRNKQLSSSNAIAGKIITFQLLWSLAVFIGALLSIFLTNLISGEAGLGHYTSGSFYLVALVFNIFILLKTASQLSKNSTNVLSFVPNLF
ncbi:helix-turn-helix domain-containing protein [Pontimicrobium sp. IMCC45349]|uniref:helix-turn-helix domain-containing protein n=1 Tax=Pontimicrobium sp. IMCC45349 TaxID=3391574 RepID=UPI0039A3CEA2